MLSKYISIILQVTSNVSHRPLSPYREVNPPPREGMKRGETNASSMYTHLLQSHCTHTCYTTTVTVYTLATVPLMFLTNVHCIDTCYSHTVHTLATVTL